MNLLTKDQVITSEWIGGHDRVRMMKSACDQSSIKTFTIKTSPPPESAVCDGFMSVGHDVVFVLGQWSNQTCYYNETHGPDDAKIPSRAEEHKSNSNGQHRGRAVCSFPDSWWMILHRPSQEALRNMLVRPLPHLALTNQLNSVGLLQHPPHPLRIDTMVRHSNTFIKHARSERKVI